MSNVPLLSSFLEQSFIPQFAPPRTGRSASQYRSQLRGAVRKLAATMERDPTVEDLSTELLDALDNRLEADGVGTESRANIRQRLRTIWRHAHKAGLADAPPPPENRRPKKKPRQRLADGLVTADCDLEDYFESRVLPLSSKIRSHRTIANYRSSIRTFQRWWQEERRLDQPERPRLQDVNDENVAACMQWLINDHRSEATANRVYTVLLKVWRFAWRRRELPELPRVEKFPLMKRERKTWRPSDWRALLKAAAETPGFVVYDTRGRDKRTRYKMIPAAAWWHALILTIGTTAVRVSAAMQLRWRHIDFDRMTITFAAESQKQRADQTFQMTERLAQALDKLRDGALDQELVFPWPLDGGRNGTDSWGELVKHYRRILQRAGLRCGRKDLFHSLRAMTVTWVADLHGVEKARDYAGHSHISVTRGYLDRSQMKDQRSAVDLPQFTAAILDAAADAGLPRAGDQATADAGGIADVLRQALAMLEGKGGATAENPDAIPPVPSDESAVSCPEENPDQAANG